MEECVQYCSVILCLRKCGIIYTRFLTFMWWRKTGLVNNFVKVANTEYTIIFMRVNSLTILTRTCLYWNRHFPANLITWTEEIKHKAQEHRKSPTSCILGQFRTSDFRGSWICNRRESTVNPSWNSLPHIKSLVETS